MQIWEVYHNENRIMKSIKTVKKEGKERVIGADMIKGQHVSMKSFVQPIHTLLMYEHGK
jgi:hypothetical protein